MLQRTHDSRRLPLGEAEVDLAFYGKNSYLLRNLSSKEIRTHCSEALPICSFKLGAVATPNETLTWGTNLTKVSSVRHRNTILRVAHGDIYTNLRLFRFKLKDTPRCTRCGQIDTLKHKLISCSYVAQIWRHAINLTDTLRPSVPINEDLENKVIGLVAGTNTCLLTIHAEILARVLYLNNEADYMLHPKRFIKMALEHLMKREKTGQIKTKINDLLQRLQ